MRIRLKTAFLLFVLVALSLLGSALFEEPLAATTVPTAQELLDRSIAFHDPQGKWGSGVVKLRIAETRPDGSESATGVVIDSALPIFALSTERDGAKLDGTLTGKACVWKLDGSTQYTQEQREKYRLTCDFLRRMRDYYVYLWGMPMKLKDPGAVIGEPVIPTTFLDQDVWSIRVTYEEKVGSDVWYFYFDPITTGLVGYRFYHDEKAGDGEYIVLQNTVQNEGLKLPAVRTWYTNAEDELLGTDTLKTLTVLP